MEGLPISNQLSSNPVVSGVFAGSGITVNRNIGDVTIAGGGGGGGTQTIVSYVQNDPDLLLTPNIWETGYTTTITTTAASSRIVVSCVCNLLTANAGSNLGRIVINGVVSSPVFEWPVIASAFTDNNVRSLQGSYVAPTAGTYTINVQFQDVGSSNTYVKNGAVTVMTNMSG